MFVVVVLGIVVHGIQYAAGAQSPRDTSHDILRKPETSQLVFVTPRLWLWGCSSNYEFCRQRFCLQPCSLGLGMLVPCRFRACGLKEAGGARQAQAPTHQKSFPWSDVMCDVCSHPSHSVSMVTRPFLPCRLPGSDFFRNTLLTTTCGVIWETPRQCVALSLQQTDLTRDEVHRVVVRGHI